MEDHERIEQKTRIIFLLEEYAHYIVHRFFDKPGRDHSLRVLYEHGTLTQKSFADKMAIRPSSSSEILARMESEGLIIRSRHDDDKRNINVTLTSEGEKLAEEITKKQKEAAKEMMLSLSKEELSTLEVLLEKLLADWDYSFGDKSRFMKERREPERGKPEI